MDIYRYPNYQYNQSDELAKQMFAQQALSSIPYNPSAPEPHAMPVPKGTPWNMQGIPWGMQSPPNLVQFTGQPAHCSNSNVSPVIHCKRKSLDAQPVIPAKQLITEEKMAAHLSGLHISSDYTSHSNASTSECMDLSMEAQPLSFSERLKGHKIVLSDEIKKLKQEPLLPPSLIERLEKPQMSLVVWKPRETILGQIKDEQNSTDPDDEEPKKRNGVLVAEPGGMDVEM